MEANTYQKAALRTAPTNLEPKLLLLNGALGLSGESGEVNDILKKHLFQGHDLDRVAMAKELGDLCWYIAVAAHALGYSLEEIFRMNTSCGSVIQKALTRIVVFIGTLMIFKKKKEIVNYERN